MHQDLAGAPGDPAARERRRRHVVAGAYALRPCPHPDVTIVPVGAMVTEAVQAAERLAHNGIAPEVVCVISPGLLFDAARARRASVTRRRGLWIRCSPHRAAPMVTVLDLHPHTLAFLPSITGVPFRSLGVTEFGQAGSLEDVYRGHGIDTDSIVRAALDVTE